MLMNPMKLSVLSAFALMAGCAGDMNQVAAPESGDATDSEKTDSASDELGTRRYEYSTKGGFTAFQIAMTIDARPNGTGLVTATETFRNGGKKLSFSGSITAKEMTALANAVPSDFKFLPKTVFSEHLITDVPNVSVGVRGKVVTKVPFVGQPVASQSFNDFASKLSDVFGELASRELVTYEASGGFAYRHVKLTIANNGQCHIKEEGLKTLDQDCYVDIATLISLKANLETKIRNRYEWYTYPSTFVTNTVSDGIDTAITWNGPLGSKEVATGTAATEPADYTAVREALESIVSIVEAQ